MERTSITLTKRVFPVYTHDNMGKEVQIGTAFQGEEFGQLWTAAHTLADKKMGDKLTIKVQDDNGATKHEKSAKIAGLDKKGDVAVLTVDWKEGEENEKFKMGWPGGSANRGLGTDVTVAGYPEMGRESKARLRAFKTYVQNVEQRGQFRYIELPVPAFRCLSGSPVLYHDWGVANGLDHAVGIIVERLTFSAEDGDGNSMGQAHWCRALCFGVLPE